VSSLQIPSFSALNELLARHFTKRSQRRRYRCFTIAQDSARILILFSSIYPFHYQSRWYPGSMWTRSSTHRQRSQVSIRSRSFIHLQWSVTLSFSSSQSTHPLLLTHSSVPSQGYSISTTTGVGGLDYGSAQGASSGAGSVKGGNGIAKGLFATVFVVSLVHYF